MTSRNILGNLAKELARRGHSPIFYGVVPSPGASWRREMGFPTRVFQNAGHPVLARSLSRALATDQVDWVHLRVGGGHRNPFICGVHDFIKVSSQVGLSLQFDDFGNPDLPGNCPESMRRLGALLSNSCRASAVSKAVAEKVQRFWPTAASNLKVIGNGVDWDWARSGRSPGRTERYILSIGRLEPYKGMDRLIWAFHDVAEQFPVRLVIAGPHDGSGHIQGLVRKLGLERRVRLAGILERSQIPGLLAGAEFFVLASRWESFGMAALEAMAAGKAVIAPRLGGFPDFIANGRNGMLFNPFDPDALPRLMRQMLQSPERVRMMGVEARRAARRHDWSVVTERYLDFWFSGRPQRKPAEPPPQAVPRSDWRCS